jgi:GDP-D-mannose 3',5'-epimerase
MKTVAVTGAGGMIGGYLVKRLLEEGHKVIASDIKKNTDWLQWHTGARNIPNLDLSNPRNARFALPMGADEVYLLAANMGGIGFIEQQPLDCILSVDITSSVLKAARDLGASRLFYSSSACAYPIEIQQETDVPALKEDDAWKGRAEYGYGEEKLFSESLCEFFNKCSGLQTRVARYHNVYAPAFTTFKGGKEKAPAALCRKVAEAVVSGFNTVEIWGDGEQTRSFMYIDDCIDGTLKIMRSIYDGPINLGSSELVTINQMVDMIEEIAGTKLKREYNLSAPQGVRGRNSDNTLIKYLFDWEPSIKLRDGLEKTYEWIYNEVKNEYR